MADGRALILLQRPSEHQIAIACELGQYQDPCSRQKGDVLSDAGQRAEEFVCQPDQPDGGKVRNDVDPEERGRFSPRHATIHEGERPSPVDEVRHEGRQGEGHRDRNEPREPRPTHGVEKDERRNGIEHTDDRHLHRLKKALLVRETLEVLPHTDAFRRRMEITA